MVRLELRNNGFLPTNGSQRAIDCGAVRPNAAVTLSLGGGGGTGSGGAQLLRGDAVGSCPHLAGRSSSFDLESPVVSTWGVSAANKHETSLEWLVWTPVGGPGVGADVRARVVVDFERGGVVRCEIPLDGSAAKVPSARAGTNSKM